MYTTAIGVHPNNLSSIIYAISPSPVSARIVNRNKIGSGEDKTMHLIAINPIRANKLPSIVYAFVYGSFCATIAWKGCKC